MNHPTQVAQCTTNDGSVATQIIIKSAVQNEPAKRQVQTCEEQRLDVLVPQTFWCRDTLLPITMPSITLTEKNIISVLGRRNVPCTRFGVRSGSDKRSTRVHTGNYHRKEVEELRNFLTSMKRRIVRPLKPEEPAHVVPSLQQKGWERGWVEMSLVDITRKGKRRRLL